MRLSDAWSRRESSSRQSQVIAPAGVLPVVRKGGNNIEEGLKRSVFLLYSKQFALRWQVPFSKYAQYKGACYLVLCTSNTLDEAKWVQRHQGMRGSGRDVCSWHQAGRVGAGEGYEPDRSRDPSKAGHHFSQVLLKTKHLQAIMTLFSPLRSDPSGLPGRPSLIGCIWRSRAWVLLQWLAWPSHSLLVVFYVMFVSEEHLPGAKPQWRSPYHISSDVELPRASHRVRWRYMRERCSDLLGPWLQQSTTTILKWVR